MTERPGGAYGPAPFFSTAELKRPPTRRVLLVSYYYPPINVVGALRWQKLSSYAAERGWAFDVLLVDPISTTAPGHPASTAIVDSERLTDLPPGTTLYTVPDDGSGLYRFQRWFWRVVRPLVRRDGSVASAPARREEAHGPPVLPDHDSLGSAYLAWLRYHELFHWSHRAARVGLQLVAGRRPDFIVSSAPPHSTHEAARLISHRTGTPWVMDMRDPWSSAEAMTSDIASRTWLRLAERYEARCVNTARIVSTTTEGLRRDLATRYPQIQDRFVTVMNGADPLRIPSVQPSPAFTIAYAGNLYAGRDPRNLFRAVSRVAEQMRLGPEDLRVEFMGGRDFAGKPIAEIANDMGVGGFVTVFPMQPHHAALEFLARATMLVSLPQYAQLAIPAKLFEYVQYNAWLLVMAEVGAAMELLFRNSNADVVDPSDVGAIAAAIRRRVDQHRRGERPTPVNHDGSFDRSRQATILLDAMERLLPPRR